MKRTIGLLLALVGALAAQSGRISGPILGYLFDEQVAGLRPLLGMPGAATMGPALDMGVKIERAAISQPGDYALAVTGPDHQVVLLRNLGGALSAVPITEAAPAPDRILLSPSGSAAALFYSGGKLVELLRGLPEAPVVAGRIHVSDSLAPLAISDDGTAVLAASPESLFLLGVEGGSRFLSSTRGITAAAFLNQRLDAVIAESPSNTVYWVRDVSGAAEIIPLAGEKDGIWNPVAVSVSSDNRRVFVANAGTGTIAFLDLAGGAPTVVSCGCAPTGLDRLQGSAVFRLTEPSGEPLRVFDGDAPQARVVFVPAEKGVQK
jgi:hypothetical protein